MMPGVPGGAFFSDPDSDDLIIGPTASGSIARFDLRTTATATS